MQTVAGRKWMAALVLAAVSIAAGARAQNWTVTKLNDQAVTDELGAIIVLGTPGSWNNQGNTADKAFDGVEGTFFDPPSGTHGAWGGIELEVPKMVTRIRYIGRTGQTGRMDGVLFQGASDAAFTDAVTLHRHDNAERGTAFQWHDVTLTAPEALQTFKFLRFIAPGNMSGGNMGEVEFYGADMPEGGPLEPVTGFVDIVNWRANVQIHVAASNLMYEVERKLAGEDDFAPVHVVPFRNTGLYSWVDPFIAPGDVSYRVRARNQLGVTDWQVFDLVPRNAAEGTWIGTQGTYAGGMTGDKVFDGNVTTYFDGPSSSGGNGVWSGLDLGTPKTVVGGNYLARQAHEGRMTGAWFEGADNPEFTGAVTLHTVAGTPPSDRLSAWTLGAPQAFRYVRFCSPASGWGNVAEVEFVLAPEAPRPPAGLSVTYSDITNGFVVLSWEYAARSLVTSGVVYRATAPGGPYEAMTPEGIAYPAATWTDTGGDVGVRYYYKVTAVYAGGTGAYESPLEDSGYAAGRRFERIERSWDDLTQVKPGITLVGTGNNYGNNPSVDVHAMFDNDTATYRDSSSNFTKPGVQFPEPHGVALFRYVPRQGNIARATGLELRGSNDASLEPYTVLGVFPAGVAHEYSAVRVDCEETFTYVYVARPDDKEFYGNIAELEIYGWSVSQASQVLEAAADVALHNTPEGVHVAWAPGLNQTGYRIERRPADGSGAWAGVGAAGDAAVAFVDQGATAGVAYQYRVVALGAGAAEAMSDSVEIVRYVAGTGTGLKAYYYESFTVGYDANEALMETRIDPNIDIEGAAGVPVLAGYAQSATNVMVVWNGKLRVPLDGEYTFYLTTDDGCALRINGAFLINVWVGQSATTSSATLALTAGEHDIRVDFFQSVGGYKACLEWAGPVTREVIPMAQLTPADVPAENLGPWQGGRTFNSPHLGTYAYDAVDGSVTIHNTGKDLHGADEGHTFVWQKIRGPFMLEALVTHDGTEVKGYKGMLMLRNSLETGSPLIAAAWLTADRYGCKLRAAQGGTIIDYRDADADSWRAGYPSPAWLRISRVQKEIKMEAKIEGDWVPYRTYVDEEGVFADELYVGFSAAGDKTTLAHAYQYGMKFSDYRLVRLTGTLIVLR